MKKILSIITTAAMVFGLAGCSSGSSASASTSAAATSASASEAAASSSASAADADRLVAQGATPKIGYLAPSLQTEFMIGIGQDLKAECDSRGWGYTEASFDNDSGKAVTSIENMVTSGVNVLLAMVSDSSCDDALKAAMDQGVLVVESGVITDAYDIALNVDQYHVGEMIAEMAADWADSEHDGKVNYVVYTTYQNSDMQNRGQGIQDKFAELCPDSTLLEVVDIGKDVVGSGTSTTETMLQKYPDIDLILCYGDAAATESVEAVKAAGKADGFGIFSCDGTESAIKNIANGDVQQGTLQFGSLGQMVAENVQKYIEGTRFTNVVTMDPVKITAENVADYE